MSNVKCQILLIPVIVSLVMVTGCQTPQSAKPMPQCPGKITITDAVETLTQQRNQLEPLQAPARCIMAWRNDKGRLRREGFDAQIRFMPPDKLFFRGDKFGEIRFGANDAEFWLRIKPELDTYWYGSRDVAQACSHRLMLNPGNLAEALGVVDIDTHWELFHRDGWDILTQRDNGRPVKRIYANTCDYRVRRIEYYDAAGNMAAATELDDFAPTGNGHSVPMSIRLMTLHQGLEEASLHITLQNAGSFSPTDRQRHNLFTRPGRDGYGTVLRLTDNCTFVEE